MYSYLYECTYTKRCPTKQRLHKMMTASYFCVYVFSGKIIITWVTTYTVNVFKDNLPTFDVDENDDVEYLLLVGDLGSTFSSLPVRDLGEKLFCACANGNAVASGFGA